MQRHATDIFRTLFPPLLALLGVLLFISLYRYGSAPTDENWFRDAPSQLMAEGAGPAGSGLESLLPGDLIAGVDGKRVRAQEDFQAALAAGGGPVPVKVFRPVEDRGFEVRAGPAALARLPVRVIPPSAHVFEVIEDGASDRAGMKRGDLIVRINGRSFKTSIEADAIMRRGQTGGTTEYVVLRGTEERTLLVKLAAFGLQFPVIIMFLCGLLWVATGGFIGLARPWLTGARLIGLALACLGFVMGGMFIQRQGGQDAFSLVRGIVFVSCAMFGMAVLVHSLWHFPFTWELRRRDRWHIAAGYVLAAAGTVLTFVAGDGNPFFFVAWGALGLFAAITGAILKRRNSSPERREVMKVLRWTGIVGGVISAAAGTMIALGVWRQSGGVLNFGFVGIPLALVPLAHLYTIGRYRLLDLKLRVRRNIQYTLAAALWLAGLTALLFWALNRLAHTDVSLPYLRITGGSLEYVGKEMPPELRALAQKTFVLAAGIPLAALWWFLLLRGKAWIAARFHRSGYDYRRAASELAEAMGSNFTMGDLAGGIVTRLAALMQLKRAGVLFFRDERSCCCLEARGFEAGAWKEFCLRNDAALAHEIGRRTAEFPVRALDPPLRDELRAHEFEYVVPIHSQHKLLGALLIGEKHSETVFTGEDLEFLGAVSRQASVAIENAFLYEELAEQERLKHELAIARRIQMESLPQSTPRIAGLDIAGRSIPAQEVGGDYFDYLDGDGRHLTVVIGDVSGKGTSAALYMAKIQGILRSLHAFDLAPAELFVRTNDLLCRDLEKKSFVTALTASFDPSQHRLTVARAGHLPLFVYRGRTGAVERVLPRGLGLGISPEGFFKSELESRGLSFETGDVFLFVTDGVTEARDAQGREFGEERLVDLLHAAAQRDAAGILQSVLDAVDAHAGGRERHDDQTVVVVKASRNGSPS